MPASMVITIAVVMAFPVPRIRLRLPVPRCKPPGQIPGLGGCGCGSGDTYERLHRQ
jgi:hypothetical protein